MQNLDKRRVAVSKPCCPSCWEFMAVLSASESDQAQFQVRARHSTLYPVELPENVPQSVVQKVVERFQCQLRVQLERMVRLYEASNVRQASKGYHHHSKSMESDSGFSNKSKISESADNHGADWTTVLRDRGPFS